MNADTAKTVANPNKALWEKGDFTEIAAFMRQSGEAIVKSLGPVRIVGKPKVFIECALPGGFVRGMRALTPPTVAHGEVIEAGQALGCKNGWEPHRLG